MKPYFIFDKLSALPDESETTSIFNEFYSTINAILRVGTIIMREYENNKWPTRSIPEYFGNECKKLVHILVEKNSLPGTGISLIKVKSIRVLLNQLIEQEFSSIKSHSSLQYKEARYTLEDLILFFKSCASCHATWCWLCKGDWATHPNHFKCATYNKGKSGLANNKPINNDSDTFARRQRVSKIAQFFSEAKGQEDALKLLLKVFLHFF